MPRTPPPGVPPVAHSHAVILMVLGLIPILLFAGTRPMGATEPGPPDQCVACHTDAAKLKALTPPDPPASEAGEG